MVLLSTHGLPTAQIAEQLDRPGPWTLPRIRQYLGQPGISVRTLYRRVRLVAIWRRPKLTARGDPDHDHVVAGIVARLMICDNDSSHHARTVTAYLGPELHHHDGHPAAVDRRRGQGNRQVVLRQGP